ncbi:MULTISPECIES: hypothetical protein [Shewanella]|uniref:hypothetical protein n=1 Tax=Shewanella TaxID=22 RepID=UPI00048AC8D6|nr:MULTISPECIES: hypothetical protein [Shewanella]
MNFRSLWLVGVAVLGMSGCTQQPEWTLLYYPQGQVKPSVADSSKFIAGYYETIEQCHAKGQGLIRLNGDAADNYLCGYQCQASDKTLVCNNVVEAKE